MIWLSFDTADRKFIDLSFESFHINTDCSNIIFRVDYNSDIETDIISLCKSDKEANEKWNELIDLYGLA